jgi:hypothetical protein
MSRRELLFFIIFLAFMFGMGKGIGKAVMGSIL